MAVDPLTELHDVDKYYGELHVLQNVSPARIKVRGGRRPGVPPRPFEHGESVAVARALVTATAFPARTN
jgi:hypothetical protein